MIHSKQEDGRQVLTVFPDDKAVEVADYVAREGREGVVKFFTEDVSMTLKMDFIAFTDNNSAIYFCGTQVETGEEYLKFIEFLKNNT